MKLIVFEFFLAVASANTCKKGLEYDAELGKCRDAFTVCPSKFYTNPKGVITNKETYLNSDITSSGNALTIVSHTSTSESIFSWHASYSTLSVNSNLNLVANNGVITTTNFSTNYDSSQNQLNIISADQPITLTFDILQIPENDYTLFVYDGRTRYSPKLLSLTGQKTSVPLTITSTGTIVSIYFFPTKTDVKYKGWQISWTPQLVANLGTGGSSTPVPSSTTTDILSSTTTAYRLNR
uniref:CUB domain-containing protein n=1 Tax=Rhabditophanes sp. KR3021 TaxID=114890 RepID=A0AC35TJ94_9BILA